MDIIKKIIVFIFFVGSFQIFGQSVSFMSFNIRYDNPKDNANSWGNRKKELVQLIEYYHPDFLGVQEALSNQVDYIQKNCSNYHYIGIGRYGDKNGEFSALFYDTTKFELLLSETFWLSNTPNIISKGWDAALNRICTYGKFRKKNSKQVIYVLNTHFDHKGISARINSAKLIVNKVKSFGYRSKIVLMGDFNSTPEEKPIKILKKVLDDGMFVSEKAFYGPLGTFNGFDNISVIDKRIDYIFVQNLSVNTYRHIDDRRKNNLLVSDHFPVFVEIKLF